MKITKNELAALAAIDASEYGSYLSDEIWSFSIADNSELKPKSIPGIVASLSKKGLVVCGGSGREGDWKTCGMTPAGIAVYLAANGGKSRKEVV